MIKKFCDLCRKEIKIPNHQVNIDINAYGSSGFFPKEYNYHVECGRKIEALIKQAALDCEPYKERAVSDG